MRVIPVIDLKGGQVVHAVGGRRSAYRPVESVLCAGSAPRDVAAALVGAFDVDTVYVADLDAIAGAEPAWPLYGEIAAAGLDLWIDAGLTDPRRAQSFVDLAESGAPIGGIVAGLESLVGPQQLAELAAAVPARLLVLSLDLHEGRPLTPAGSTGWHALTPRQIVEQAVALGVMRMLVLDLVRVGSDAGIGTRELCQWIDETAPQVELSTGGGVRGLDDLRELAALGCDAALVASALHRGRLSADDLRAARLW